MEDGREPWATARAGRARPSECGSDSPAGPGGCGAFDLPARAGGLADMREKGICESFKVKQQVVLSASEAAEMILRVDDIVQCAPRRQEQQGM